MWKHTLVFFKKTQSKPSRIIVKIGDQAESMENIQRKKAVTSVRDVMYPESQLANKKQSQNKRSKSTDHYSAVHWKHWTSTSRPNMHKWRQVLYTDNISVHFTGFDGDFQSSVRQLATAFLPMSKQHEELSSKENKVVADLAGILQDEVPNCLSRNNSFIYKVCRYIIWNNYRWPNRWTYNEQLSVWWRVWNTWNLWLK